mgnify:CR=1 FL=1
MDYPSKIILLTVFVQVFFTLWTIIAMGKGRVKAVQTSSLTMKDIALDSSRYPDDVLKLGNNMRNQFETPVLLYTGVAMALTLGAVNWIMAGAAVAYIVTRFRHRWIHVGHNNIRKRFMAYVYGLAALAIFWVALGVQVFVL